MKLNKVTWHLAGISFFQTKRGSSASEAPKEVLKAPLLTTEELWLYIAHVLLYTGEMLQLTVSKCTLSKQTLFICCQVKIFKKAFYC